MKVHDVQVLKEKLEEDIAVLIEKFKKDTDHPFFNADISILHPHSIKDPHRVRVTLHI